MNNKKTKNILIIVFTLFICLYFCIAKVEASNNVSSGSYGWGFAKNKRGEKPDPGKIYLNIISKHNAIYVDNTTNKRIYLTFDAGYENGYTEKILDILKKHNVNATFFLTGQYLRENEGIIKRMVNEKHIVGNHTWGHPDLTKISKERYITEIKKLEDKYYEITGQHMMKIMRAPSGQFSDRSLQYADDLGYYNIFWSLAYKDWETNNQRGWEYAYNNVMNYIHPGAIILMHNCSSDNAEALEKIIVDLKKDGYEFASVTRLILARQLYVINN